jgi:DNA-binding MarR family transcriptional regulator
MQRGTQDEGVAELIGNGMRALVGIAARSLAEVLDDVSLPQYRVLVLLHGRGPLSMGELAASLDVNPSTVTRVCDVLVDKKLIRRMPAVDNRRGVCAHLTVRGRRVVDQVMRHREALIQNALSGMSVEGKRQRGLRLSQFAEAAGEVGDHAWTLGWSAGGEADGGA